MLPLLLVLSALLFGTLPAIKASRAGLHDALKATRSASDGPGHGAWECRACLRAFAVTFLGQVERPEGVPSPVSPGAGS